MNSSKAHSPAILRARSGAKHGVRDVAWIGHLLRPDAEAVGQICISASEVQPPMVLSGANFVRSISMAIVLLFSTASS
jgi:hypothetical protein